MNSIVSLGKRDPHHPDRIVRSRRNLALGVRIVCVPEQTRIVVKKRIPLHAPELSSAYGQRIVLASDAGRKSRDDFPGRIDDAHSVLRSIYDHFLALSIYGRSRVLKSSYNWIVGKRIIRDAGACVAIANNEIPQFAEYGVPGEHVTVIPNGIDPEEFSTPDPDGFRAKFRLPDAPFILFMGRLNPIKGPDLLLRAFAEAQLAGRGYHLVFAGPDGGLLETLKTEAARAGIAENVRFIGHVGAQDKVSAYRASELLVIPSRQEAMSIVVLEAGACDRPVLITDRCGFDEVERIGGGRVVPSSADGIKSGLLAMLSDATGLRAMGEKLGEFVRGNFLWEFACKRYLDLFSRLLHGNERSA